jgi:hypothetical protein
LKVDQFIQQGLDFVNSFHGKFVAKEREILKGSLSNSTPAASTRHMSVPIFRGRILRFRILQKNFEGWSERPSGDRSVCITSVSIGPIDLNNMNVGRDQGNVDLDQEQANGE